MADLTPEERRLAAILGQDYFNGMAKEAINRTSNLLEGFDKAMGRHYSPIITDKQFLSKNDAAILDATIEGGGMLKERQRASNPALAVSVWDAYERHRDFTAKYVGLAIPVRNMKTLLNYTERGFESSMRSMISHTWGKASVEYLDQLLLDLQSRPVEERGAAENLFGKIRNGYVTAMFGMNPGTVLKQALGFFMAGARLGFDTMPKTSMLRSSWKKYRGEIAEWTPLLEWRARGYSSCGMEEMLGSDSAVNKWMRETKLRKFIFGGAIQWMDLHTCAAVWPWAKNHVRKHYPDLEEGSAENGRSVQRRHRQQPALARQKSGTH